MVYLTTILQILTINKISDLDPKWIDWNWHYRWALQTRYLRVIKGQYFIQFYILKGWVFVDYSWRWRDKIFQYLKGHNIRPSISLTFIKWSGQSFKWLCLKGTTNLQIYKIKQFDCYFGCELHCCLFEWRKQGSFNCEAGSSSFTEANVFNRIKW